MEELTMLINVLNSGNQEFRIADGNGNIIYSTPMFNQIIKNSVEYNPEILNCDGSYYEIANRDVSLKNQYKIVELINVDKYVHGIISLKEDRVTTLPNRNEVEDFLAKNQNSESPFIIVMCDVDDFKRVNDEYGHQAGDAVLNELGKIFRENIRNDDYVGRFGGEEFLMVFRTEKYNVVLERLKRIREQISQRISNKVVPIDLTFSAGMALYQKYDNITEVLKNADSALYHVKNNGKNGEAMYEFIKDKSTIRK